MHMTLVMFDFIESHLDEIKLILYFLDINFLLFLRKGNVL
ncbi:hypothetical protein FUAX_09680 [Fulvitalea axinellae]|uniref:Uncharacterized protein n=1 Tax=Fulvitalea axinellae TaxID=1182444 RepID=A0AAU9CI45_9BACT|nr:hypothetical protein FUAX_09680 [Fulvitalea axinellae]